MPRGGEQRAVQGLAPAFKRFVSGECCKISELASQRNAFTSIAKTGAFVAFVGASCCGHGFIGIVLGQPGERGLGRDWQRRIHCRLTGHQQVAQQLRGQRLRQRCKQQGQVTGYQCTVIGVARCTGRQVRNPGRDKTVPLQVVAPGTDGVGYCGDTEKALIFRLEHPAQPALQTVLTVLEMHR
ncbi:hypothetical protein D9M73_171430 [compost metagenome]